MPSVLRAAAQLEPAFTHGDLYSPNILLTRRGTLAVDWERSAVACPAIDLAWVDVRAYAEELAQLDHSSAVDATTLLRAATSGRVLSDLGHQLERKAVKKQLRYLGRMVRLAETLVGH